MHEYNKLVRDEIPSIIRTDDEIPIYHEASDGEYEEKLAEKLVEEAKEFEESHELEELADVLEVVRAIRRFRGVEQWELQDIRHEKHMERGGFSNRIILEEVEPK